MFDEESRFISGIHNYCDRWCERCRFTDRCRVYAVEQAQRERHLLKGEDPDAMESVLQDVAESMGESVRMLQQMAEERGIDLDAAPPPRRRMRDSTHPLRARVERWSMRVRDLLTRVRTEIPAIGADLASIVEELSAREQAETMEQLERLRDAYELLMRYHLFLIAKIARATHHELEEDEESDDPVVAEAQRSDAVGTAKLVHECLGKAATAIWCVGEFSREWRDEAIPLAAEAESLRAAIDAEFPGHRAFRRPGLDDPDDDL